MIFALTLGDPAGIGPEITIKALSSAENSYPVVVIGDLAVLQNAARILKIDPVFHAVSDIEDYRESAINVLDLKILSPQQYKLGAAQPLCGKASYLYIQKAIDLAIDKQVDGVITNPINKESLRMAGINFPGHTEIFAQRTNSSDYSMLFLLRNVGVAHVTTHCSLREAIGLISKQRVLKNIHLLNRAMKGLGVSVPRIAVAGLNPHAGENGLFGDEEIIQISPAIQQASKEGIVVSGPYPPDTVFMRAFRGEFDGIVSMLHDHGFVALKSMDFEHGVNITIGLPIIRTSVGHGTAYDLAGKGLASEESLKAALRAASLLCKNRREKQ
ncbi:MAG: 4-hydroxythreonine-4-phosphate dehydrogenase PdxA [Fibrobacter sp.]|jgi:4-hydroxythreonine-4-phosphate dehydrogenase|nr:4-hydroxythreonine-4-phosphate dehydrogenase PdxA [Fibrobacter sp.]